MTSVSPISSAPSPVGILSRQRDWAPTLANRRKSGNPATAQRARPWNPTAAWLPTLFLLAGCIGAPEAKSEGARIVVSFPLDTLALGALGGGLAGAIFAWALAAWVWPFAGKFKNIIGAGLGLTLLIGAVVVLWTFEERRAFRLEYDAERVTVRHWGRQARVAYWAELTDLRIVCRAPWFSGIPGSCPDTWKWMELEFTPQLSPAAAAAWTADTPPPKEVVDAPLDQLPPLVREEFFRRAFVRDVAVSDVPPKLVY